MSKLIKDWKHIPGMHCGSAALRDVSWYYGYEFSEELCFGLGGGLGFYYTVDHEMSPQRAIHVRGPGMEARFIRNFGIDIRDWKHEDENKKAFEKLRYFIDNDIPVLVQTDIFHLGYYNSSTHFPGHIIVVCGYDDDSEEFMVSDTGFEDVKRVPYKSFERARTSKARPYPLSNNWMEADLSIGSINLAESALDAIRDNARQMLEGVKTPRGISGVGQISLWAAALPEWKDLDEWSWSSRYAYQVIAKRGTEGAAFRIMYRDFLKEIAYDIPQIREAGLIQKMHTIGKAWINIASGLKTVSEKDSPGRDFNSLSTLASEIHEMERDFYSSALDLGE